MMLIEKFIVAQLVKKFPDFVQHHAHKRQLLDLILSQLIPYSHALFLL
jgi:hypothetical protein